MNATQTVPVPAVIGVMLDHMSGYSQDGLVRTKRAISEALTTRNFEAAVGHCPDPIRWLMLDHCVNEYGIIPQTVAAFKYLWEHGSWLQHGPEDRRSMTRVIDALAQSEHRRLLFTPEDQATFEALPERLTIYRGVFKSQYGMHLSGRSWTLSEQIAGKFACVYRMALWSPNGNLVMKKTVSKAAILYYISVHDEQEIVLIKPTLSVNRRYFTKDEATQIRNANQGSTDLSIPTN